MAAPTTSELFTVVEDDRSISLLKHIFGGIIDTIHKGTALDAASGSVVSEAFTVLNLVMMMVITVVGLYSIMSMAANTASDGIALGQSTDTKYTLLRMGIGAILFLPVKGGFAVIQLLALYLVYMGVGLADYTWNQFSESYLKAESYTGVPDINTEELLKMRGEFGRATYALTAGYLCQMHLNRIGDITGAATAVTFQDNQFDTIYEHWGSSDKTVTRTYEMFFNTNGAARNSNDLCGKVEYSIAFVETSAGGLGETEVSTFERQLHSIARDSIFTNTKAVLGNTIKPRAADLALRIYSGGNLSSGESLRDNGAVASEIRSIATSAANALYSSRNGTATFSNANMEDVRNSVLDITTEAGWILAPLGQRKLSQIHMMLREYRAGLELSVNSEVRPLSLFQSITRGRTSGIGQGSIDRSLFDPVTRDIAYLGEFAPLLLALYERDQGLTNGGIGIDDGKDFTNKISEKIYSYARSWFNVGSDTFVDPYVTYMDVGYDITFLGGALSGGASLLEGVASIFGMDDLAGVITGPVIFIGNYLMVIGIVFMIIIPSIPIAYFISAILSWMGLVIEAMFALPVALAVWFLPARDPSLIGPWQKVVLSLFSLLLRPFFTIVGLVLCVLLLFVGNTVLNWFFSPLLSVLSPKPGLMTLITILGLVGLYAYMTVMVALHSASFITILGDEALSWIGARMGRFTEDSIGSKLSGEAVRETPTPKAGPAIGLTGSSAKSIGKRSAHKIKSIGSQ